MTTWTFLVDGTLEQGGKPLFPCEAIVEPGDRDEDSPFRLEAVGPGASTDRHGQFQARFLTAGATISIRNPERVSVYVRVAPGSWRPVVVRIDDSDAVAVTDRVMRLSLGRVVLPADLTAYVPGT